MKEYLINYNKSIISTTIALIIYYEITVPYIIKKLKIDLSIRGIIKSLIKND